MRFLKWILTVAAVLAPGGACETTGTVFRDHGIAAPVGQAVWGGPVTTLDKDGRPLILMKLWAPVGEGVTSTYLFIDARTGDSEQVNPGITGAGAFTTYLSRDNKFYDTLGEYLIKVDVENRSVKRLGKVPARMAYSITECDEGMIYAAMYPGAELVIYNPLTGDVSNHGPMAGEEWPQYPTLAVDDKGWVYILIGMKQVNLVGYNPATGEKRRLIEEQDRKGTNRAAADNWRAVDGKVYARPAAGGRWYRLYGGEADKVSIPAERVIFRNMPRPRRFFPDGTEYMGIDVANRTYLIRGPEGEAVRKSFDYHSEGAAAYYVTTGEDGRIYGSTGIPLRFFRYCPETKKIDNWGLAGHGGHINVLTSMGGKIYGTVYSCGSLISYDPSMPFEDDRIARSRNPRQLHSGARDVFGRPFSILAHPDGRHILTGGNPARIHVGGGMLIYDTQTGESTILRDNELLLKQGVNAITAFPDGTVVIGGTVAAATGATGAEAEEAEICVFDWDRR